MISLGNNDIKKLSVGNTDIKKASIGDVLVWSGMPAGDETYGFYGEVLASEFITGNALASAIGLTAGTAQFSNEPWLKFALDGKVLYVAKKTYRYGLRRSAINDVGAVTGTKTIQINGDTYKVRLLKGATTTPMGSTATTPFHYSEWNKLMLPIHIKAKTKAWATPEYVESDLPDWNIGYTDVDLHTVFGSGNGTTNWCQDMFDNSDVLLRGAGTDNRDTSSRGTMHESSNNTATGWRPVLELVG